MIGFIRKLMWFIKSQWKLYLLVVLLGIFFNFTLLWPPRIIGDFINEVSEATLTQDKIPYYAFMTALSAILIYIAITSKRQAQNHLAQKLNHALQMRFLRNILAQDAMFFEKYPPGDLMTRALGDIRAVYMSGVNRLINIALETLSIIITMTAMIQIHPKLTLISVIPLPIIFIVNITLKPKVKRNWRRVREASSDMGNAILESITNVRTLRAFNKEKENEAKLKKSSQRVYKIEQKNLLLDSLFLPIFQSVVAVSIFIALWFGTYMILDETLLIGDLITLMLYLNMLAGPLTMIGNMINNFNQSLISLDRLEDIYHAKSVIPNKADAQKVKEIETLEFKHIFFKYENDSEYVLKDINLTLKKGETLGIVGKTGSGKTTLVRQMIRQFPINDGDLLINNTPIGDFHKESVREHIGYVPQEHTLFSRSVDENIKIGAQGNIDQSVLDYVIEMADFKKDILNLPKGRDTIVGEYGVTLSGGQKQRLAIARAFMRDADILVLDDSLSAVDGKTEANIIKNLKKYRHGKTNIIVSHRLTAVKHADNIIVLDQGKIIEQGTHDALMALQGWYFEQYESQRIMDVKGGQSHE